MKIKKNTYAEYIKSNNNYYCYSYQLGTLVIINEQDIVHGIDCLLNEDYIDVDHTHSIWAKLIENNIVLNVEVDETLMAEYTYQNFFIKTLVDKILVLSDGRIAEEGKHEELLKINGEYARLFNLQASKYE